MEEMVENLRKKTEHTHTLQSACQNEFIVESRHLQMQDEQIKRFINLAQK